MEKIELPVFETLKEGSLSGFRYFLPLIGTFFLWAITIWIPYINIGTTIALQTIPGRIARGEKISPTFIFGKAYRRDIVSFLLEIFFIVICVALGYTLGIIFTGIVVSLSLSFATFILVDDNVPPVRAMRYSVKATDGYKWNIFGINLIFGIIFLVIYFLIAYIIGLIIGLITRLTGTIPTDLNLNLIIRILHIVLVIIVAPITNGIQSVLYKKLYMTRKEEIQKY